MNISSTRFQDGRVLAETSGANAQSNSLDFFGNALRIGDGEASGSNDRGYRSIVSFPTASIPSNVVVTGASLLLTRGGLTGSPSGAFGTPIMEIKKGFYGTSALHGAADFAAPPDFTPAGNLSIPIVNNVQGTSPLLAGALPFVNQAGGPGSGITQIKIRYANLTDNDGTNDYYGFYSAWAFNSARRPVLRVTYINPASNINVFPGGIDFPDHDIDAGPTAPPTTITISNLGAGSLTINSITLGGTDPTNFAIATDTGQATLAPGQTRTLGITFDPAAPVGPRSATITVDSTDANTPIVTVPLTGNGVNQEIDAQPPSVDFGVVLVNSGQTPSQSVVISNIGSTDLSISNAAIVGLNAANFTITSDTGEGTLAPAASRTFGLAMIASASPGFPSASLRIDSDDADESQLDVPLVGTVVTPTPSPTPSPSPTDSPTPTPTPSPSLTETSTPTPTISPSETPTETPSPSHTPTLTPSETPTPTPTASETPSLTPTPTPTLTPSQTASATPTPTASPTPNAATDWEVYD